MGKNVSKLAVQSTVKPQVYNIRGKRVVLDRELAAAFGVETKQLKRVAKRHPELFAGDKFAFELTEDECSRYQFGTMNSGRGSNLKYLPFAFTEAGVQVLKTLMKSNVEIDFTDEPLLPVVYGKSLNGGTVALYQINESVKLDVLVEDRTVWLTQDQMGILFNTTRNNISLHINNIFNENELEKSSVCKESLLTATDGKTYKINLYNLKVIISVGYRVKSPNGTAFRQWANELIDSYLLRRFPNEDRIAALEVSMAQNNRMLERHEEQLNDFFKSRQAPAEQIFMQGQFFDAYKLFSDLIRSAKERVIIIDNYVDESVLELLKKRNADVIGVIYTSEKCYNNNFKLDLQRYNAQYPHIDVCPMSKVHDRFMIIDDVLYSSGGSFKDAGKKLFSFERMELSPDAILKLIGV